MFAQKNTKKIPKKHKRFAWRSFQELANIFCVSLSCVCEWLFKFDWLSNANKGHSRISRCACSDGRERTRKAGTRGGVSRLNSSVKAPAFKKASELEWPLSKHCLSPCVYNPQKEGHWYIYSKRKGKKHSNLLGARPPLYLPSTFQQRSRGSEAAETRQWAGGRARQKRERREAGIKSACWKKQDGHKRWTKLQRGLFLSKANGNISTQHREGSGGSIITAEQTELAAIPEERRDARAGPA